MIYVPDEHKYSIYYNDIIHIHYFCLIFKVVEVKLLSVVFSIDYKDVILNSTDFDNLDTVLCDRAILVIKDNGQSTQGLIGMNILQHIPAFKHCFEASNCELSSRYHLARTVNNNSECNIYLIYIYNLWRVVVTNCMDAMQ